MGGIGILMLVAVPVGWWFLTAPGGQAQTRRDTGDSARASEESDGPNNEGGKGGGAPGWLSALVASPRTTPIAEPVDRRRETGLPDPRAARLVMTFSCTRSPSASRFRICTDWGLATADYNLSLLYRSVLAHSKNPRAVRRANAGWQAGLDKVGPDTVKIAAYYADWRNDIGRR